MKDIKFQNVFLICDKGKIDFRFTGSELSGGEVSQIQLATSRNVVRKHSMKAINTCK